MPRALKSLKNETIDELEKFVRKGYEYPFLSIPHDYISCSYHKCNSETGKVELMNTMVNPENIYEGMSLVPHVWFLFGGYIFRYLFCFVHILPNPISRSV